MLLTEYSKEFWSSAQILCWAPLMIVATWRTHRLYKFTFRCHSRSSWTHVTLVKFGMVENFKEHILCEVLILLPTKNWTESLLIYFIKSILSSGYDTLAHVQVYSLGENNSFRIFISHRIFTFLLSLLYFFLIPSSCISLPSLLFVGHMAIPLSLPPLAFTIKQFR
jgi:hypothetical protein